jgi:hypothetical protein
LCNIDQWVVFRWEKDKNSRLTKPPYQARFPDRFASTDDPNTWTSHNEAVQAVENGEADGIGFVLTGTEFVAVDLDACRNPDSGKIDSWAQDILTRTTAYFEITVSGAGLRIIGTGRGAQVHTKYDVDGRKGAKVELFRKATRYITISGLQHLRCNNLPNIDRLIDMLAEERPHRKARDTNQRTMALKPPVELHDLESTSDIIKNGAPEGSRSEAFQSAVWLRAYEGKSVDEIVHELEEHPRGIAQKYQGRVRPEVERSYGKWRIASGNITTQPVQDEAPPNIIETFTFLGDAPATPPKELVRKLLPAYGVAVTGGQSSAGKTFVRVYRAVCLAAGLPYFGHGVVERVGTVLIPAEGRAFIPNRFAAAVGKVAATNKLPIAWQRQLPDFKSLEGIKLFIAQLKAMDARFRGDYGVRLGDVCIDTVAACFAMKDEDDNAEATKVSNILLSIGQEVGCLMSPVHHYGKNPESGLRGASAWRGSADVVEGVLADIDPLSGRVSNRELVCAKARDGEQGTVSGFDLEWIPLGQDIYGEDYGSMAVVPTDAKSRFDGAGPNRGMRALRDAIAETMDGRSTFITPRNGMAPVKAIKVKDLRKEFDRHYVVDDTDPKQARNTKAKAFRRALDHLPISEFSAGSAQDEDWIWRI